MENCNVCASQFDPSDYRFNIPTIALCKRWHGISGGRRAIARKCGFQIEGSRMLCVRCCTLLSNYITTHLLEPSAHAGDMWLAARLHTLAIHVGRPDAREKDNARKRARRSLAISQLQDMEQKLEELVWDLCPYGVDGEFIDDFDAVTFDDELSWEELHEELMEHCLKHQLRSRYNDVFWHPEPLWEAYRLECEVAA